jgi:hypothetical protein
LKGSFNLFFENFGIVERQLDSNKVLNTFKPRSEYPTAISLPFGENFTIEDEPF